jgi:hypothetical protein
MRNIERELSLVEETHDEDIAKDLASNSLTKLVQEVENKNYQRKDRN